MPGFGMEWPILKSSTPSLKRASERRPGALLAEPVSEPLITDRGHSLDYKSVIGIYLIASEYHRLSLGTPRFDNWDDRVNL